MDAAPLALLLYSAQILVVVGAAGFAIALARISSPAARLSYWRAVGLLCLGLPLLQFTASDAGATSPALGTASILGMQMTPYAPLLANLGTLLVWICVAGAVARLAWLAVGAARLRQLRRRSEPATLGADVEALRHLAPRAELRCSADLAQPVTFGLRRPVILLPSRFANLDLEAQRAVACHELVHVARRDWAWIVLEEIVRTLFWFHPAIWLVVEQVQLAREQLVDEVVVARTTSRRAYMQALLNFADAPRPSALSISLLRKRHLRARFRQLSKESHMSFTRLALTTAILVLVMGVAGIGAARALPFDIRALAASPAAQGDVANSKDPDVTLPVVVSSVKPQYTQAARDAKIQGEVMLSVVVLKDGNVGDVTVTKSLDTVHGLDDEAVKATKQWKFKPGTRKGSPVAVRVSMEMRFTLK